MKSYLKTAIASAQLLLMVLALMLFRPFNWSDTVHATLTQEHVLNTGINLGWAEATLSLRGDRLLEDANFIQVCLNRAAQHIWAAANGFEEPFRADRLSSGVDRRLIERINRYPQQAPRLSLAHRASYIHRIWSQYRQSFQTSFMDRPRSNTDRTTGYQYFPNCEFYILNVGYHFGRAHIAAGVSGNPARSYQSGGNGSMRTAIQGGLNIALDGYQYGTQTNVRKACCCFGNQSEWARLPSFQSNSPFALYADSLSLLQRIVRNVFCPPGSCGGESRGGRAHDRPVAPTSCQSAGMTKISKLIDPPPYSGTSLICQDRSGTTWIQTGAGLQQVSRIDKGNRNPHSGCFDNTRIISQSRTYVGALCGEIGGDAENDALRPPNNCQSPGLTITGRFIDPPPYSGTSLICQDRSGTSWLQTGSAMQRVTGISRGNRKDSSGCFHGSRITTPHRTFEGTLCGR